MADNAVVTELFGRLQSQLSAGQRKKALRTVDEVLKSIPHDNDALKTKAVLLIELDKFDDVLVLFKTQKLGKELWFEKAYCQYRMGSLEESLTTLDASSEERSEPALQLRAQLLYRLGRFESAIEAYNELYQNFKVSGSDTKTNVAAAYAAADAKHTGAFEAVAKARAISVKDGFETAFNMACVQLRAGQLERARELLLLGMRAGRESLLDEEFTDEQVDQELAPLAVQLAYIAACSGDHSAAVDQCQEVLALELSDEGVRAVAANNLIAQQTLLARPGEQRPVLKEALKQSDRLFEKGASLKLKPDVAGRLSSAQQEAMFLNRVLLLLSAGRTPVARDLLQQLLKRFPDARSFQIVRAALLARDGKLVEADAALQSAGPSGSGEVALLRAQLALQSGDREKAVALLSEVSDAGLAGSPAFVTTQAAILEAAGRIDAALRAVGGAQRAQGGGRGAAQDSALLPVLARLQLKAGKVDEAFETFKQLRAADSSAASAQVVSQLAAAALTQNPSAATSLRDHLEDLPDVSEDDAMKLESAGTKRMAKGGAGPSEGTKERKRKRRKRLPKNFDPDNPGPPPDPERWLPKWQRAEFRRKRRSKKDKEKAKAGHQGGAVDETLDRTNAETPAAGPALPKRAKPRGKGGRR